jgi:NADPH-dependent 2,4-dienoyl-CoA reductase/sulfur reductase-like enzyme
MEAFMEESGVDAIAMGRALIADPFLPKKLLRGQADQITPCLRCGECQSGLMKSRVLYCAVNPLIGSENNFYHPVPTNHQRTVLIVGGGPAGCQAAMEAVARGHKVVLCEQSDKLGGLKYADNAEFKHNIALYRDNLAQRVAALPIDLRLNTTVTQAVVDEVKPDALIIAIGAQPWMLPVPRDEKAHVVFGADLRQDTKVGDNVVVVGGGLIGSEEAVALAREGHKVTILEMQDDLAPDCGRMHRINLMHQIETEPNITAATGHRCSAIKADCVTAVAPDGSEVSFPADTVIMAAGMRPDNDEVARLRALVPETYVVGDAFRARQIGHATREGRNAVIDLGL